jgi:hypothetical protein
MFLFPFISLLCTEPGTKQDQDGQDGSKVGKEERKGPEEKQTLIPRTCLSVSFPSLQSSNDLNIQSTILPSVTSEFSHYTFIGLLFQYLSYASFTFFSLSII